MTRSKYPPTERISSGRMAPGDRLLIRDRQSDQPYGTVSGWDAETRTYTRDPLASGVWTVVAVSSELHRAGRRASRIYTLELEHPGAGRRTITASASERFGRVIDA